MVWLAAIVSGVLWFLTIPPQGHFWLAWVGLLPLLWAHRQAGWKKTFVLGWLAGASMHFGVFHWIYECILSYSAIPLPGALLLTALLALQQGLSWGLALALSQALCRAGKGAAWWVYGSVFAACEFLYPIIFPVFLGNSQFSCLWTSQWMDLAGPGGLSFVLVAFNVALWSCLQRATRTRAQLAAVLLWGLLPWLYGALRVSQVEAQMAAAPRLKVAMIENQIGIVRSAEEAAQGLETLQQLAASHPEVDLVVFPETAVKMPPPPYLDEQGLPGPPLRVYPLRARSFEQDHPWSPQRGSRVPLVFGATATDPQREGPVPGRPAYFNAAFLLDGEGRVLGTGLKNKLLMFGEFVPGARWFPWIYTRVLTMASSLTPGSQPSTVEFQGHRLGLSICYEDILPWFSYQLGQQKPQLMVNLTNDAWFGETAEPGTHLGLSRARAIELRLYLVRSTTTGISAYIDPLGRVMASTRGSEPQALVGEVGWMPGGTPFQAMGMSFSWFCVALTGFWAVQSWRARRRSRVPS